MMVTFTLENGEKVNIILQWTELFLTEQTGLFLTF